MAWLDCSTVLGAFVFAGTTTCRKRLAAVKTPIGLLPGVRPLVRHNVALLGETFWAYRASVRLLARVGPLVRRNISLPGETFWAYRASVGLLARVRPLVLGNVALLGEPPRTHGAATVIAGQVMHIRTTVEQP